MRLSKIRLGTALSLVLALVVAGFLARGFLHRADYDVQPGQQVDPASAFTGGQPNLVGAMFYSAWCSSCAVLDPRLRKIAPEFEGRAVRFVKFDFSMGPNDTQAEKAAALGIAETYEANKGATGFMLLVDSRSETALGAIYMTDSDDDIRQTINAAIQAASDPMQQVRESASLRLVVRDKFHEHALAN